MTSKRKVTLMPGTEVRLHVTLVGPGGEIISAMPQIGWAVNWVKDSPAGNVGQAMQTYVNDMLIRVGVR